MMEINGKVKMVMLLKFDFKFYWNIPKYFVS